jgi:hypothetical protein
MNRDIPSKRLPALPRWTRPLAAILLAAFLVFVWSRLPGGAYPTDLSRVGAGQPVLVLTYDSNATQGVAVMDLMNLIRDDYAGRVDFLVAHLGVADGQDFARRHAAVDGTVLVFAADGRVSDVLPRPRSVGELRQALDRVLVR